MGMLKTLLAIAMVMPAMAELAAEATKEPPPTWPWPWPTPSEQREAMMKRTFLIRPTPRDLKQIEALTPDKPHAPPQKPRKLLFWGRVWTHMANPMTEETVKILGRKTGAFDVVATDDPQMLLPEKLKDFDALFLSGLHDPTPFLPHWFKAMPKEEQAKAQELDTNVKASILKFVGEDGKGLAGIEGSIGDLPGDTTPSEK